MSKHEIGCLRHCPRPGGDSNPGLIVVVVVLGILAYGAYHVRKGIETGINVALYVMAIVLIAVVVSGAVFAAVRVRRALRQRSTRTAVIPAPHTIIRLGTTERGSTALDSSARPAAIDSAEKLGWQPASGIEGWMGAENRKPR
jgi:hypothetical protein